MRINFHPKEAHDVAPERRSRNAAIIFHKMGKAPITAKRREYRYVKAYFRPYPVVHSAEQAFSFR